MPFAPDSRLPSETNGLPRPRPQSREAFDAQMDARMRGRGPSPRLSSVLVGTVRAVLAAEPGLTADELGPRIGVSARKAGEYIAAAQADR